MVLIQYILIFTGKSSQYVGPRFKSLPPTSLSVVLVIVGMYKIKYLVL